MFKYIGEVQHSYHDYQHLLKYKRIVISKENETLRGLEMAMENLDIAGSSDSAAADFINENESSDNNAIEIEVK